MAGKAFRPTLSETRRAVRRFQCPNAPSQVPNPSQHRPNVQTGAIDGDAVCCGVLMWKAFGGLRFPI